MSRASTVPLVLRPKRPWLVYVVVTAGLPWVIIPLLWMFTSALKSNTEIFQFPPDFFPASPIWSNFVEAARAIPFMRWLVNSLIIAVPATAGTVLTSAMAAYAFARLRFRGNNLLFTAMMATLLLPGAVTLVPGYLIFTWLGWVGTFLPVIVPSFLGGGAFSIFMLRQFFRTIPRELDEAARIDGANTFQIFFRVILPQSIPALVTVGLFTFVAHWNDFFGPLIYLSDQRKYTLTVGLSAFRDIYGNTQWNYLMADSLLATVPMLLIFLLLQRVFIQGVVVSGVKG